MEADLLFRRVRSVKLKSLFDRVMCKGGHLTGSCKFPSLRESVYPQSAPVTCGTCFDLDPELALGMCAEPLLANMDYVVDDVVRQVAVHGSSSARRLRGQGSRGGTAIVSRSRRGGNMSGETGIPAVVEAVLRIGGPAMGPALVGCYSGKASLREMVCIGCECFGSGLGCSVLVAVLGLPRGMPGSNTGVERLWLIRRVDYRACR